MTVSIAEPDALDDAISRGYVREQIAAANAALAMLDQAGSLMALHRLAGQDDIDSLDDVTSNLRGTTRRLQEALDIAMRFDAAPRRPTAEMMERIT